MPQNQWAKPADGYAFNSRELAAMWERPEPTWMDISLQLEKVYTFHLMCVKEKRQFPDKHDSKHAVKRIVKALLGERFNPEPESDAPQTPDLRD